MMNYQNKMGNMQGKMNEMNISGHKNKIVDVNENNLQQ